MKRFWVLKGVHGTGCAHNCGLQFHRGQHSGQSYRLSIGSIKSPQPQPVMFWQSRQKQKYMGPETGWRQHPIQETGNYTAGLRSVLGAASGTGLETSTAVVLLGHGLVAPGGQNGAGFQEGTHRVILMTSLCRRPWLVTCRWDIPSHRSHVRCAVRGRQP